jgi:hypothetical protein
MKKNFLSRICTGRMPALFLTLSVSLTSPSYAAKKSDESSLDRAFKARREIAIDARAIRSSVERGERVVLPMGERQSIEIALEPHDLRAPDYRAEESVSTTEKRELSRSPVTTLRGEVRRSSIDDLPPGSEARLTLDGARVAGALLGKSVYFVEPVKDFDPTADPASHVIYRSQDVNRDESQAFSCGVAGAVERTLSPPDKVPSLSSFQSPAVPLSHIESLPISGVPFTARIATEADYEFVSQLGGSDAANNEILSILNVVDGVYSKEVGLTFQVAYQHTWTTSNEQYNASGGTDLLGQFRDYWNANYTNVSRDLAHLFSGRDITTGEGGLAYQGSSCGNNPSFAYGFSRRLANAAASYKYGVTAHELGHNLGAVHPQDVNPPSTGLYGSSSCVNTIMGPNDGSATTPTFCGYSRLQIINYMRSQGPCGHTFIRGRIYEADSPSSSNFQPVNGVVVTLRDPSANVRATQSDYNGYYIFLDVISGTYTISVKQNDPAIVASFPASEFSFMNSTSFYINLQTTSLISPLLGANTSIDGPMFFVRQHYIDFLNRAPDDSGLAFWTNEIASCAGNAACIDLKRQNVSAAYFLSIEFQQTGYLVYKLYKAAYGNLPGKPVPVKFADFMPDVQTIGQGVVVGQSGWDTKLESNKQAFVNSFVARAAFTAKYGSLSNSDYVAALNANAGGALSASDVNALVSGLNAGTETRATVLRKIAENKTFDQSEFSRAFVLMQYFGYLRRDPDGAPDTDFSGYNFWLNKLNSFGGDYIRSEMVRSFIVSDEYRDRF